MKLREGAPQSRIPEEGGEPGVPLDLIQADAERRWARSDLCPETRGCPRQNIFLVGQVENDHPLRLRHIAEARFSAQQAEQKIHSGSHAGGPWAARAARRERATGAASPRGDRQAVASRMVADNVVMTRAGVR